MGSRKNITVLRLYGAIHSGMAAFDTLCGVVDLDHKIFFDFVDPERSQHTRHSSNKLNLKINPFRTEIRRNSFSIRAAKAWNELPIEIREARTLNSFKNKYDDHKKVEKMLLKSQY